MSFTPGGPPRKKRRKNPVKEEPRDPARGTIVGNVKLEPSAVKGPSIADMYKEIKQIVTQYQSESTDNGEVLNVGRAPNFLKEKAVSLDVLRKELGEHHTGLILKSLNKYMKLGSVRMVNSGSRPYYMCRPREVALRLNKYKIRGGSLEMMIYEILEDAGPDGATQAAICRGAMRICQQAGQKRGKTHITKCIDKMVKQEQSVIKRKETRGKTHKRYVTFIHRDASEAALGCFWQQAQSAIEPRMHYFLAVRQKALELLRSSPDVKERRSVIWNGDEFHVHGLTLAEMALQLNSASYGHEITTAPPDDQKQIKQVMDVLVYDGKIEELGFTDDVTDEDAVVHQASRSYMEACNQNSGQMERKTAKDAMDAAYIQRGNQLLYRLTETQEEPLRSEIPQLRVPAIAQTPCLSCPDRHQCVPDPSQPINPFDCTHMDKWLGLDATTPARLARRSMDIEDAGTRLQMKREGYPR